MKRSLVALAMIASLACACFANLTELTYSLENIDGSRWQYNYQLQNIALEKPIEEFTIWFSANDYDNISVAAQDSLWDFALLLDVPNLGEGFDGLAIGEGVSKGQGSSLFSVSFDWLGTGIPGSQFFEIVDTTTYQTLDSGSTTEVPEPTSLAIFALASLVLRRKFQTSFK